MLDTEFWLLWGLFAVIILGAFIVAARKGVKREERRGQTGDDWRGWLLDPGEPLGSSEAYGSRTHHRGD